MATWGPGMQGQSVADIQRWIANWGRHYKVLPANFLISGTYDAATQAALRAIQAKMKLPQTGLWDAKTQTHAIAIGKFLRAGDWKSYLPKANSIAEDRKYVRDQFIYLYGREPTATELSFRTSQLQGGMTRANWSKAMETLGADDAVKSIFKEMYGREPTAGELTQWSNQLKNGTATRKSMKDYLAGTHEYLTKPKEEAVSDTAEDQKVALEALLDEYGLGSLKSWAWEQIKSGVSDQRIIQELRQTDEYKARFPAMAARGGAGLPAISESEYLTYERNAREVMRRAGFPPGFYDDPNDFSQLLVADISVDELQSRVNEGYDRVVNAPVEVRQAFAEMYGVDGDAALAALYVDPDKAEQALLKQTRAAEAKGWGGLFGMDFTTTEAESLADVDLATDQLRQGFQEIQANEALFNESISEATDLRAEKEGVEAAFATGGDGANQMDQRRRERIAALSGGGGANISQEGLALGAAD